MQFKVENFETGLSLITPVSTGVEQWTEISSSGFAFNTLKVDKNKDYLFLFFRPGVKDINDPEEYKYGRCASIVIQGNDTITEAAQLGTKNTLSNVITTFHIDTGAKSAFPDGKDDYILKRIFEKPISKTINVLTTQLELKHSFSANKEQFSKNLGYDGSYIDLADLQLESFDAVSNTTVYLCVKTSSNLEEVKTTVETGAIDSYESLANALANDSITVVNSADLHSELKLSNNYAFEDVYLKNSSGNIITKKVATSGISKSRHEIYFNNSSYESLTKKYSSADYYEAKASVELETGETHSMSVLDKAPSSLLLEHCKYSKGPQCSEKGRGMTGSNTLESYNTPSAFRIKDSCNKLIVHYKAYDYKQFLTNDFTCNDTVYKFTCTEGTTLQVSNLNSSTTSGLMKYSLGIEVSNNTVSVSTTSYDATVRFDLNNFKSLNDTNSYIPKSAVLRVNGKQLEQLPNLDTSNSDYSSVLVNLETAKKLVFKLLGSSQSSDYKDIPVTGIDVSEKICKLELEIKATPEYGSARTFTYSSIADLAPVYNLNESKINYVENSLTISDRTTSFIRSSEYAPTISDKKQVIPFTREAPYKFISDNTFFLSRRIKNFDKGIPDDEYTRKAIVTADKAGTDVNFDINGSVYSRVSDANSINEQSDLAILISTENNNSDESSLLRCINSGISEGSNINYLLVRYNPTAINKTANVAAVRKYITVNSRPAFTASELGYCVGNDLPSYYVVGVYKCSNS